MQPSLDTIMQAVWRSDGACELCGASLLRGEDGDFPIICCVTPLNAGGEHKLHILICRSHLYQDADIDE